MNFKTSNGLEPVFDDGSVPFIVTSLERNDESPSSLDRTCFVLPAFSDGRPFLADAQRPRASTSEQRDSSASAVIVPRVDGPSPRLGTLATLANASRRRLSSRQS